MKFNRIAVTGGRDYADKRRVWRALTTIKKNFNNHFVLVVGDAKGADALAREWADYHGHTKEVHRAKWMEYGRTAGPVRNQEMIDAGFDFLLAFPGGRGTADMIERTKRANIPYKEYLSIIPHKV